METQSFALDEMGRPREETMSTWKAMQNKIADNMEMTLEDGTQMDLANMFDIAKAAEEKSANLVATYGETTIEEKKTKKRINHVHGEEMTLKEQEKPTAEQQLVASLQAENQLQKEQIARLEAQLKSMQEQMAANQQQLLQAITTCTPAASPAPPLEPPDKPSAPPAPVPVKGTDGKLARGRQGRLIRCFKCNELGHYSRECPTQVEFPKAQDMNANVRSNLVAALHGFPREGFLEADLIKHFGSMEAAREVMGECNRN